MESSQSGLLERLRAQRESMQTGGPVVSVGEAPVMTDMGPDDQEPPRPMPAPAQAAQSSPAVEEHAVRLSRLESNQDDIKNRLDSIESNLRSGLNELRGELPGIVTAEVSRHLTPTNEAVADLGGRLG